MTYEHKTFDDFHNTLSSTISKETKIQKVKVNQSRLKPWFNNSHLNLWKQKHKYYRLKNARPDVDLYKTKYKEVNLKLIKELRKAKKFYYDNQFRDAVGNGKKIWELTNSLIQNGKTHKTPTKITLKDDLGNYYSTDEEVTNKFNTFFIEVGSSINNNSSAAGTFELTNRPPINNVLHSFELATEDEIHRIIMSLKSNTAMGYDDIPVKFLKDNVNDLTPCITNLINKSINDNLFPNSLKIAKVTIIHKMGDPTNPSNYRPISVLSAFSKIFETILKSRIINHLQNNNLIHPKQYGFLQKSNTTTAAANLLNSITSGLASKKKVSVLFLDIVKAFDCVDFRILSRILKSYGIDDKAHSLLMDYFSNRTQFTVINSTKSSCMHVNCGCAQGSILGPLIFLIYINDLLHLNISGDIRLYADDAAIVYTASSYHELFALIKNDMPIISNFLLTLNFQLSITKSKFMVFAYKNSLITDVDFIDFNNQRISRVSEFKYLGIYFDSSLNWQYHASKVASSIAPYVGMIRKTRTYVSRSILLMLYYAFIHSKMIYGLPVWHSVNSDGKRSIQVLQNKAIKYIHFFPPLTPSSSLYDDSFLSFHNLIKYECILYIYKVKAGLLKSDSSIVSNREYGIRQTRQSDLLRPASFINASAQSTIFYYGVVLYNGFTRYLSTRNTFINTLKVCEVKKLIKIFCHN